MNEQKQYEVLVEIQAQARLLAAHTGLIYFAENLKEEVEDVVVDLGYTVKGLKEDSIQRYLELNEEL